jgi:hypothetical protein
VVLDLGTARSQRTIVAALFVMTVALVSAVAGDAFVEGLSNAGMVWHGRYTDRSSVDLLPVSLLAAMLFIGLVGVVIVRRARECGFSRRALILSTARILSTRTVTRLLPLLFIAQIAALFAMESCEQIAIYGHGLGGNIWLGGPVVMSLMIHASIMIGAAFGLARMVQSLADRLLRAVTSIVALFIALADDGCAFIARGRDIVFLPERRVCTAHVDRGPPYARARLPVLFASPL